MADININKPVLNKGTAEANIAAIDTWISDVADKLNSVLPSLVSGSSGGGETIIQGSGVSSQYVRSEISKVNQALLRKQDILKWDETPTKDSSASVTSGAIYAALIKLGVTVDTALSQISENPVQNKAVYAALQDKQDKLEVDTAVKEGSTKLVTGGAIYSALSDLQNRIKEYEDSRPLTVTSQGGKTYTIAVDDNGTLSAKET